MKINNIDKKLLNAVQEYVQEKIATAGSQNEAARQLNMTAAHLINFRDANWGKISLKKFNQVAALVGYSGWRTCETENLIVATSLADQAQQHARMIALTGYTGSGKTSALKLYARKTPQAYYVLCDAEMNKKRFLFAILQAIGVRSDDAGSNVGEMIDAVCRKLNGEASPLLILDDSGKLSDSLLRIIQIIYDRTEGQAGILLAGTEYLKESIDHKARKNRMGFRELKRRVAYWEEMTSMTKTDVVNICTTNGITDKTAIGYLYSNVSDFGTLRNMIQNAKDLSADTGEEITRAMLAEMNNTRTWYNSKW